MNEDRVSIPLHLLEKLLPMAQQQGLELPGMGARFAPTIDVNQTMNALALEIGRLVAKQSIFVMQDRVVTVDELTGEVKAMTARRFVGWVESYAAFKTGGRQKRDSLAVEDAGVILDQDIFRSCLRPLHAVHKMRLPVRRAGELWDIEFLPAGYDAQSGIFTVELLKYDMEWDLERATAFLDEHGDEYCFTWSEDRQHGKVLENRSWAVQIAAMVGTYCRALFEPGTPRPIMLYVGNKPGTGKSTLVAMALMPVYGTAAATTLPKDEDKMTSTLETVARTRRPYLFFDDVGGGIFNNALYQFITSRSHAGRVMGGNEAFFEEPNVTHVFCTGNDIKFDHNLRRRALVVELFLSTEVRGRKFKRVINTGYLAKDEVRGHFLSALCAIVKNYINLRPKLTPTFLEQVKPLESFEGWTDTVSLMVQLAGYADPLGEPDLAGAGAEDEDEMKELLIKVASGSVGSCSFDRKQLVERARELGLCEALVGAKGDADMDSKSMKSWGRRLQRYRGQEYTDERGRRFRFSHRRQKKGANYPLTFLKDGKAVEAEAVVAPEAVETRVVEQEGLGLDED